MTVLATLDRLSELGVSVSVNGGKLQLRPGSRVPADLVAELRQSKPLLVMAIVAFYKSDRISAMLGCDAAMAAINRLGWLYCDLTDAGLTAEAEVVRAEERRLGRQYDAEHGLTGKVD